MSDPILLRPRPRTPRTKTCPHCEGRGHFQTVPELGCMDCLGKKVVCILCWQPPGTCECPEAFFEGDLSGMDRPPGCDRK